MRTVFAVSILLLSCSSCAQKGEQIPAVSKLKDVKPEPSIAELKRLYEAASSPNERRAVCLRAIDAGVIQQGRPVSTIDAIFGSHCAADLPTGKERIKREWILFAPQSSPPPRESGVAEARAYVGWHMDFDYDSSGTIQNYYLSNLHKESSRRVDAGEPTSIAELKRLYEAAQSEQERRAICLRAIDEGVIQTFGPVRVSTVDAIFGTHLASDLPTGKEGARLGLVDFASAASPPGTSEKVAASAPKGWFMAVEYYHDGNIANYYLTNVHK